MTDEYSTEPTGPDGSFRLAGKAFRHRRIEAASLGFHVVEGGQEEGPAVVLLAGFPQSWYAWRRVMPLLCETHHVIAIDLPGQGDSEKPLDGYDTETAGERIHALLVVLGLERYFLVGHDIGSWIAYPYAARYPDEVRGLVLLDGNIPGITLKSTLEIGPQNWKSWHFLFHIVPDLPEALYRGNERVLIEWFFSKKSSNKPGIFTRADIDEYVRVYQALGGMRGMLGYYRAVHEDMAQNAALSGTKLKTPLLALGGSMGSAPDLFEAMKPLAENLEGGVLEDCGHYIPEEKPEELARLMLDLFSRT
jgi:pimeloyl-ACP methyl ester carboxylesterase